MILLTGDTLRKGLGRPLVVLDDSGCSLTSEQRYAPVRRSRAAGEGLYLLRVETLKRRYVASARTWRSVVSRLVWSENSGNSQPHNL